MTRYQSLERTSKQACQQTTAEVEPHIPYNRQLAAWGLTEHPNEMGMSVSQTEGIQTTLSWAMGSQVNPSEMSKGLAVTVSESLPQVDPLDPIQAARDLAEYLFEPINTRNA